MKSLAALAAWFAATISGASGAPVTQTVFGHMPDGRPVHIFTLTNRNGLTAQVMEYGGALVSLKTPDRSGKLADVILGFDNLDQYIKESPDFGALVGRYANRIANGQFTLDGKTYTLAKNAGPNNLHSGPTGFDKLLWSGTPVSDQDGPGVALSLVSPDGDMGFPGTLTATVTYRLTNDNRLTIDYRATTDKTTVVNLTFHGYFNLSGDFSRDVLDEALQINASRYTPVNATLVPAGDLAPVAGTPLDFTKPKPLGRDIAADNPQIKFAHGYDHNFVLDNPVPGTLFEAARASDPSSGRVMTVWTTQPGLQLYTANYLRALKGKGVTYQPHAGFCLEAQHFPDSPNQPQFPSTILRPGEVYAARTEYRFTSDK
ncbi:MAG TPA: aldose epimerase family protein [Rhizomicrobium sp.]